MNESLSGVEILLIEDNHHDIEITRRAFQHHGIPDEHLFVLEDGEKALDYIFCQGEYCDRDIRIQPKLILLDLKLPFIGGLEVLRQIKVNPRTEHIPVVVLTSSNQDSDVLEAYHSGANSYLVKTLDFDVFVKMTYFLMMYWTVYNQPPRIGGIGDDN